jgi:hypothetical protein
VVQDVQSVQIVGGIMLVKNFEDLEIWKEARRLTL